MHVPVLYFQGYLGQILHSCYKYRIIALESKRGHTSGADKRIDKGSILAVSKLSEGIRGFFGYFVTKTKKNTEKIPEDSSLTHALSDSILFVSKFKA